MTPRSRAHRLSLGAALLFISTLSCSLVVSTDALQAGAAGLGCGSDEKVCPDPDLPGRGMCVSDTNPSFGCGSETCAACALPNAVPRCLLAGGCAVAACVGSHRDCNGTAEDGCEIDLSRDEQNCGACNNACTADRGAVACSAGSCVIVFCQAPYADCDHKYSNGCETNTDESSAHCGACNQPCAGTCVSGECQP